ncbi:HD family phosphohydrolase [Plebeiibacterium marinum]|uniref:HDIG domain-containing protein n=1 Tax=Plebeiibacterium marinum TaxID=2992111 RepID=A0AAE3MAL6_9BACT|nr:HDIG domain-containing metalloprotein [Plebeiobacterium marinum]MCW3804193.1 HDIG domain-containing protein [Plebeiobacterium marinum]
MKNFLYKLKRYSQTTYRILLFLAAVFLIANLMPREGKFQYEFKKGEPWRYEVLIAPFNFRIYKTDIELNVERDSILKNFRPYFVQDSTAYSKVNEGFLLEYTKRLTEYKSKYKFLRRRYQNTSTDEYIKNVADSLFRHISDKGVISLPDEYMERSDQLELMLVRNNLAEPYLSSEFYSLRSAYQFFTRELAKSLALVTNDFESVEGFVSELQVERFLVANVSMDGGRSESEKSNLLKNMALTKGIVLAGQKIIDKGEIIDEQALKKLDSYKKEYEARVGTLSEYNIVFVGHLLISFLFLTGLYLFLYFFRHDVYSNLKYVTFLLLILCTVIALAYLSYRIPDIPMWVIPFTILPLIVRTFMDARLGYFIHVTAIILASFFSHNSFEFIFLQIPAGITAIFSLYKMVRRSQIVRSAIFIFITYSLFYTGLTLLQEGGFESINYEYFLLFTINAFLIFIVYPLIYIFEKLFGFLSDVTLVELSDTNHPLLRNLAENAPGTFQHSIQVGNIAQEAAYKIDANPLLVRAGAMYHDIGKTATPLYFTENQISGVNPHNDMDYEESAKLVINHIEEGIKIARKYNLPEKIIDFIATHQGTTKAKYFYNSYINKYPDKKPIEENFTYPGPSPFTKETAILMMADSIEAASRSLKEYSDEAIDKLVENIINGQIKEEQFFNAPITFREIKEVKEVFKAKLKNIYHARVAYPKIKKGKK